MIRSLVLKPAAKTVIVGFESTRRKCEFLDVIPDILKTVHEEIPEKCDVGVEISVENATGYDWWKLLPRFPDSVNFVMLETFNGAKPEVPPDVWRDAPHLMSIYLWAQRQCAPGRIELKVTRPCENK